MVVTAHTRQAARRGALLSASCALTVTGAVARASRTPGISILLIHKTPQAGLERLVRFVERHRARLLCYDEAVNRLAAGSMLSRPAALGLSFDDGFVSNMEAARRLAALGVRACFFIPTDVVGKSRSEVDAFFRRPQSEGVMTWAHLEELMELGHSVGSHCKQHKALSEMSVAEAEDQVKGSAGELRTRLGAARHFAWPFGSLRSAPAALVSTWCAEAGLIAASGVRGRNVPESLRRDRYLRRDAVELRWIDADVGAFDTRSALWGGASGTRP